MTRTTITEEFVREFVTDKEHAKMLMQFTDLFFDIFEVKKRDDCDLIAYGTNTRKMYRIETFNIDFYPVGTIFEGRIHLYNGKYNLCGITTRRA